MKASVRKVNLCDSTQMLSLTIIVLVVFYCEFLMPIFNPICLMVESLFVVEGTNKTGYQALPFLWL